MEIKDIYTKYKIPPNLQEHMIRVAAVGIYIVDHWKYEGEVDKDIVTQGLLLHDMGNIIKFNLDSALLIDKKDIPYWKKVQQEFKDRYGEEEHLATTEIAKEIGVGAEVLDLVTKKGKSSTHDALMSPNWNMKIRGYADLRIDPYGVVTLTKRFEDVLKRYEKSGHYLGDKGKMKEREEWANRLEKQIQEKVDVDLQSITDETIAPYIEKLNLYDLVT